MRIKTPTEDNNTEIITKKFLLIPKYIDGEWVWLETVLTKKILLPIYDDCHNLVTYYCKKIYIKRTRSNYY